jgi:hypothetical protein
VEVSDAMFRTVALAQPLRPSHTDIVYSVAHVQQRGDALRRIGQLVAQRIGRSQSLAAGHLSHRGRRSQRLLVTKGSCTENLEDGDARQEVVVGVGGSSSAQLRLTTAHVASRARTTEHCGAAKHYF